MAEDTNKLPEQRAERIGKFQILAHLASGGMGIVYKARDTDLDRTVALKILPPDLAKQQNTLIRFRREAKAAALLRHENIVSIYEIGETDGTHYIALEFIEGHDLQFYINRKCRLDPDEARQIMIQAAKALAHAHEHRIVHRDVKPSNLLLMHKDKRLIVKLTDFGLAIRHENDAEFRLTKAKTTVGTVDYMAPEQARNSRSADIRSDIYSLGCTAFHMLAGAAPFARGTLPERIVSHMQAPPPDVRKLNKQVPAYLVTIINRMLAKKPEDRYQTPAELLADLEHPDLVEIPLVPIHADDPENDKPKKKDHAQTAVIETKHAQNAGKAKPTPKAPSPRKPAPVEDADDSSQDDGSDSNHRPIKGERPKKKSAESSPIWMYAIGGTVLVLAMILVAVAVINSTRPPPKKPIDPPVEPPPIVRVLPRFDPPKPIDTAPSKMTVPALEMKLMGAAPESVDRAALRKEYTGKFAGFPQPPQSAVRIKVGRLAEPGPTSFRTLDEAVAQTKDQPATVIEIHDNGPLFVSGLPASIGRFLTIRGAEGYHPLLVWETPKKSADGKALPAFASILRGALMLENLDFVMQTVPGAPAVVFDMPESDFYARYCTFSIGGKASPGVSLVRRVDSANSTKKTLTAIERTYVRGSDVTLFDLQGGATSIYINESLVAGQQLPLIHIRGRDDDEIALHCLRSTLVCGQTFLRWQPLSGKGGTPDVASWVLDSIVSRDDPTAALGDMIHLADGADAGKMRWRAANSMYCGWKRLLYSEGKSVTDLDGWHRQWLYTQGDRFETATWPTNAPSGLEEQAADTFLIAQSPYPYAALLGHGWFGCVAGWLPTAPVDWLARQYQPRAIARIPAADTDVPRIPAADDGLYHGERLDLTKIDLGLHLNAVFKKMKPAPRVVLHLTGKGACESSPLRIRGVQHLVLYGEPSKDVKDPFTLEFKTTAITDSPAAIDMSGGTLELIGVRARLSGFTLAPALMQLTDNDLIVTRSWLEGPLVKPPDAFQSLLHVGNPSSTPATVLMRDSVLLSAKEIVVLQGHVQLKARNNLLLALGDAVVFEADGPTPTVAHTLERNTFAVRRHTFVVRTTLKYEAGGVVTVNANSNAFLAPFVEGTEKGGLVRGADAWLSHSRWAWQGRYNVYDGRLHNYLAPPAKAPLPKQVLRDWQQAWGQAGEFEPSALDVAPTVKVIPIDAATMLALPFDRLTVPRTVRGDPDDVPPRPPGADLFGLGVAKKKG